MVAAGNPFREALNYLRFLDFREKNCGAQNQAFFEVFSPGRPPQAPGPSKSQKSDPKYACQQILSPNCPQNGKFWEGRSPLQFPGEEIPPKKTWDLDDKPNKKSRECHRKTRLEKLS